jgi:anti-sigma factor RsiW
MTTWRPDDAEIGAYVDGELGSAAAARVAYAAARDPAIAAAIAQITKLKSAIAEAAPDIRADEAELRGAPRGRRPSRRMAVASASIACILLLACVLAIVPMRNAPPPSFFDAGVAAHRAWSAGSHGSADRTDVARPASAANVVFAAPDLSAAQLALRTAEAVNFASGNFLHFGYVGTRGCRLSLFVRLDDAVPLPDRTDALGLRAAAWAWNGVGYLAVADGMDETHFRAITEALRQYTIERTPFGKETEDRLAVSRLRSKPCAA